MWEGSWAGVHTVVSEALTRKAPATALMPSVWYVPWPDRLIPQRALFAKSTDVRERLFDIAIGDSFNTLNGECASQLATPIRLSAKMPESMLLARESVVSEALTAKYAATDSAPLTVM